MAQVPKRDIITDKLVIGKTGRAIEEWFQLLDGQGAKKMTHTEIFKLVSSIPGLQPLGEWNHNLLITSYEWSRGIKERGQKGDTFEISVSKTIEARVSTIYKAWAEEKTRNAWLGKENITIRKATENKSARVSWNDDGTSLSIDFYPKGENKSQIVVQHLKLPDSKKATDMKLYWNEKLGAFKNFIEETS